MADSFRHNGGSNGANKHQDNEDIPIAAMMTMIEHASSPRHHKYNHCQPAEEDSPSAAAKRKRRVSVGKKLSPASEAPAMTFASAMNLPGAMIQRAPAPSFSITPRLSLSAASSASRNGAGAITASSSSVAASSSRSGHNRQPAARGQPPRPSVPTAIAASSEGADGTSSRTTGVERLGDDYAAAAPQFDYSAYRQGYYAPKSTSIAASARRRDDRYSSKTSSGAQSNGVGSAKPHQYHQHHHAQQKLPTAQQRPASGHVPFPPRQQQQQQQQQQASALLASQVFPQETHPRPFGLRAAARGALSEDRSSMTLSRPRKQSRGGPPGEQDHADDAALRREKQGLIEKLQTYISDEAGEDEEDYSDDDGDVSGEDVFSEDDNDCGDDDDADLRAALAASSYGDLPSSSLAPGPWSGAPPPAAVHRHNPPSSGGASSHWRITTQAEGRAPSVHPERFPSERSHRTTGSAHASQSAAAVAGQRYGRQRPPSSQGSAAGGMSAAERNIRELQSRASTARDIFAKVHSTMYGQYNARPSSQGAAAPVGSAAYGQYNGRPSQGAAASVASAAHSYHPRGGPVHQGRAPSSQPAPSANSRGNSFHSKTSRRNTNAREEEQINRAEALTKKEEKSRGIFANLEAQIMQRKGIFHDSCSSSSPSDVSSVQWTQPPSVPLADPSRAASQAAGRYPEEEPTRYGEMPSNRGASVTGQASRSIITNMETVIRAPEDVAFKLASTQDAQRRNGAAPMSFQRSMAPSRSSSLGGADGSKRHPSREVIASIEADMMRLEEQNDQITDEYARRGEGPETLQARLPGRSEGRDALGLVQGDADPPPPRAMDQRDVLSIMMRQQEGRGNRTLTDQISNMAIDINPQDFRLPALADDSSSSKSINSCASYDGKFTNVFASRARTHEQELACHALNAAICDLYGAPVKGILAQYPMVTRLIRADDETGNIQLHYAVRNGNVKAMKKIVRTDPGCALIRNMQGYCPLHFAVQIGNFAAVQLLCCMAPASATVQCEEGCLPLHEAVSSAAHLSDAPQIAAVLINAFPSAIKMTNDEGLLPLHLAAMSGFSAGIRTIFAYGFSTIYARENTEEMLPLDFAIEGYNSAAEEANGTLQCDRRPNEQDSDNTALTDKEKEFRHCIDIFLMSALYDRPVFTHAARNEQRGMTFLPIHGAAASHPCSQSWKRILSMYGREYASDVDVRGRTALHVLVTSTPWYLEVVMEMIQNINELEPTSTTTFDDSGLLPLHAALTNHAPYHVVEQLLLCNWSTISMEVDEDCDNLELRGMLPFQLAAACGCGVDVLDLLLRAHPTGVSGALPTEGS